jgi:hypothetical protein
VTYLDGLVPSGVVPGTFFDRVRALRLSDDGQTVDLGPLDRATLTLVHRALASQKSGVYLTVPRGGHDLAVLIGIYLQLIRGGAQLTGERGCPVPDGPIVVIGLRTNATARLGRLAIGRQNLSPALGMRRIRGDGRVVDLQGRITTAVQWPFGLFYLNTAVGRPALGTTVSTVVIDRTSMGGDHSWERALAWAADHRAAHVVAVADLGAEPGGNLPWVQWPCTPALRSRLHAVCGPQTTAGSLSTNALMAHPPSAVPSAAVYRHDRLADLRRTAMVGAVAARRVRSSGAWPRPVADAMRLLNLLWTSWGPIGHQDSWHVTIGRGSSARALARSLETGTLDGLTGPWAMFRETHWPDLRRAVLSMYKLLHDDNPRWDVLLSLIAWARANRPDARVVVRTGARSSAAAVAERLAAELGADTDTLLRTPSASALHGTGAALHVLPYSERLAWDDIPGVELHLGVPPTVRTGLLFSGAAVEHVAAVEEREQSWLERSVQTALWHWSEQTRRTATALTLGAVPRADSWPVPVVFGPVDISSPSVDTDPPFVDGRLRLDLTALFEDFDDAARSCEEAGGFISTSAGVRAPVQAVAVHIEPDGATVWLRPRDQVDVLLGHRCVTMPVGSLTPGCRLLLARGDGQSRLYDRLVGAVHSSAEVTAMDTLIGFFRQATLAAYEQHGSWPRVLAALKGLGSQVSSWQTVSKWADGEVIAPEDPHDIHRMALIARDRRLTAGSTWQRLGRIAAELRRLHRALGHSAAAASAEAARGRQGPALRQLAALCSGIDVSEILEEFDVVQVRGIGCQSSVPARLVGRRTRTCSTHESQEARWSTH